LAVLEEDIAARLVEMGLTLGTVESASGGLISHLMTNIPGSSRFFKGSIVAYSNEVKTRVVGVKPETIEHAGAVSAQVASEMAAGGRRVLEVDICLSDTGVAGPGGGTPSKPVGLFYIGLSCESGTHSRGCRFGSERLVNKQSAAEEALGWLNDFLSGSWTPELP
jgi:PncC family amidohydrolase